MNSLNVSSWPVSDMVNLLDGGWFPVGSGEGGGRQVDEVAQPVPLGAEVGDVLRRDRGPAGDAPDELELRPDEAGVLVRVVRDQADPADAELGEHGGADAEVAAVDGQAELEVRVDRVPAAVLQLVRPQLVAEPDAAALVAAQVDHGADAFLGDHRQCRVQLGATVAALGG